MAYIKKYKKPYEEWHNKPVKDTPITAEVMECIDTALSAIEYQLEKTTAMYNESPPMINMGNEDKTLNPYYSIIAGGENNVSSSYSIAGGNILDIYGSCSLLAGYKNTGANVHNSVLTGSENKVESMSRDSLISGCKNTAQSVNGLLLYGEGNSTTYSTDSGIGGYKNKMNSGTANDIIGSYNEITSSNGGNVSLEGTYNKNITGNSYPHKVIGRYNDYMEQAESHYPIFFEVGNGDSEVNRSNAMYLDSKGNMRIAGDLIFGETKQKLSNALKSASIFDEHGYAQMYIGSADKTAHSLGQTLRIRKDGQADLWISAVNEERVSYTYKGDLEGDIKNAGGSLQIGYYSVSLVKGEKQDLTDYAKKTDIQEAVPVADADTAGKVKPDGTTITVEEDGTIHAVCGLDAEALKQELMTYIDSKLAEITGNLLGGAS